MKNRSSSLLYIDRIIHVSTFCINHSYSLLSYLEIVHFFFSSSSLQSLRTISSDWPWHEMIEHIVFSSFPRIFSSQKRLINDCLLLRKVNAIRLIDRWHKLSSYWKRLHDTFKYAPIITHIPQLFEWKRTEHFSTASLDYFVHFSDFLVNRCK